MSEPALSSATAQKPLTAENPSGAAEKLAGLCREFPGFRIWREITGDRTRYIARSLHAGTSPHTVVTDDLGELRDVLGAARTRAAARRQQATMNSSAPGPGDATAPDDDAAGWQAARQLRSEHPKWLVIWVARTRRYHAYPLSGFRPGTGLTDTQPAGLANRIEHAERAAASRPARPRRARTGS